MQVLNTRKDYLSSIEKFNSRDLTRKALIYFDQFLSTIETNEADFMLKLKGYGQDPQLYLTLNSIVLHLINHNLHPRTIRSYFIAIKLYLRNQGVRIYNEDIKTFVKLPRILKEAKIPLDHKTIQKLLDHAEPYLRFVILAAVSSGARISELLQLTYGDLKYPYVHIRAETVKFGVERKTFFSSQVWQIIDALKSQSQRDNGDYVFCSNYIQKKSLDELETKFSTLRHKAGLSAKYNNSNVHTITIHRFRAFCKTMASEVCNKDYAEGLIGHEGYLGTYNSLSNEEKLNNYLKLESKFIFKI